jgi:plastocyanin
MDGPVAVCAARVAVQYGARSNSAEAEPMKTKSRLTAMLAGGLLLAAVAGAGETVQVEIRESKFIPDTVTVKVGTTVKWLNAEKRSNHSVWFKQEQLPESDRFFPGESWSRTFDRPGTYRYTCGPHPEMNGTVMVTE